MLSEAVRSEIATSLEEAYRSRRPVPRLTGQYSEIEIEDAYRIQEEFVRRNNEELVATWGNLANRVLGFAYKRFDGKVPQPGPLDLWFRAGDAGDGALLPDECNTKNNILFLPQAECTKIG